MSHAIIIEITNAKTRNDLLRLQKNLKEAGIEGRYDSESFHISLVVFPENLDEERLEIVKGILTKIEIPRTELIFDKIDQFPHGGVIFAHVEDKSGQLKDIYNFIHKSLQGTILKDSYTVYPTFIPFCSVGTGCFNPENDKPASSEMLSSLKLPAPCEMEGIILSKWDVDKTVEFKKVSEPRTGRWPSFGGFAAPSSHTGTIVPAEPTPSCYDGKGMCRIL